MTKYFLLFGLTFFFAEFAISSVRLPSIIGSHMVLQQNTKVKIWGWADPREKILLKADWDTTNYYTVGSSSANWMIELNTPASGSAHEILITGYNKIVLTDVVMGEVWVCSGQSNMEMNMGWGLHYPDDVANATDTSIRFFYVPKSTSEYPQNNVEGKWVICTPDEMKQFSAVGYFFGKKIRGQLNVPVGLINSNWGGTPAEVWTPSNFIETDTLLLNASSKLRPNTGWPIQNGIVYNAMIYPITNYSIAGVIWYQGEANVNNSYAYRQLLTTMIGAWRKAWNKDLPFYYVQIAPFAGYGKGSSSSFLREAQSQVLQYPNTGMVLTSDLVDNINDIHPKMKKEVGIRLANYALAKTYGQNVSAFKSPMYKEMKLEKNKVRIYFDDTYGGLLAKDGEPNDFYIAGADKKFVPAKAKIERNTVVVWSDSVPNPIAVRFGFKNDAMPNLFSKNGLPVNLFRTDKWDDVNIEQ